MKTELTSIDLDISMKVMSFDEFKAYRATEGRDAQIMANAIGWTSHRYEFTKDGQDINIRGSRQR